MAPGVPPLHEVKHRQHAEGESFGEGESPYHREKQERKGTGGNPVLEPPVLVARHPLFALPEVGFGNRGNVAVVNKVLDQVSLLLPGGRCFAHGLLVKSGIRLEGSFLSSVHGVNLGHLINAVVASVEVLVEGHVFY